MRRRDLISVPFWCVGCLIPSARALDLAPLWQQRGAASAGEEEVATPPSPESKRWHREPRELGDVVEKRLEAVERDVKEANEKIGNVRVDVAVVRTLMEGLTKEVATVRGEAKENKDELTKQMEKNHDEIKAELRNEIAAVRGEAKENKDELKSDIQKAVAEIKEQIDFVKNCGFKFAVFSWVTFVGGKLDWGKFFDWIKQWLRIS
jgi:chromosome segregation ATPase